MSDSPNPQHRKARRLPMPPAEQPSLPTPSSEVGAESPRPDVRYEFPVAPVKRRRAAWTVTLRKWTSRAPWGLLLAAGLALLVTSPLIVLQLLPEAPRHEPVRDVPPAASEMIAEERAEPSVEQEAKAEESTPIDSPQPDVPEEAPPNSLAWAKLPWVDREGPPYHLAMATAEMSELRDASDDNAVRQQRLMAASREKVHAIVESLVQQRVQTRLFVVDVTPSEVTLLADASWGWPVDSAKDVGASARERRAPRAGLVWLKRDGAPFQRMLSLTVGDDIPPDVAASLRWGDRVTVEFDVVGAETVAASLVSAGGGYVDAGAERVAILSAAGLHCLETAPRLPRAGTWPGWGTFPDAIARTSERRQALLPFLSTTLIRGTAQLQVKGVTPSKILLVPEVTPNSAAVPVSLRLENLAEELALPLDAIGEKKAAELRAGDPLLVAFEIVEASPMWPNDQSSMRTGFGYTSTKFGVSVVVRKLEYRGQPLASSLYNWLKRLP